MHTSSNGAPKTVNAGWPLKENQPTKGIMKIKAKTPSGQVKKWATGAGRKATADFAAYRKKANLPKIAQ